MKIEKALKWFFESFIWLGLILLGIDILTKNLIIAHRVDILNGGGLNNGIDIIPGFLGVSYVINPNVAFGMGSTNPLVNKIIFSIVASLITVAIIIFLALKWDKTKKLYRAVAMMVIAGALGNLIDRIFYTPEFLHSDVAGVVDWIDFYGIWKFNFNIADSCVCIAAAILIVDTIVTSIKEARENKKTEVKEVETEKVMSKTEKETIELRQKDHDGK